ncbi:MAG TPA: cobyric acid synthase [Acidimicrobiia bacterium]|nr:cobyric acid synthase [Acidimicrobiia bacterium]
MAGTASGVGKSTIAAGLCRWFARQGASVAPFKAQNMSNHSAVTADGGEIGRAQAMQAAAAGVTGETAMNPILLKPSSESTSHVVVRGVEIGRADAAGYGDWTVRLRPVVLEAWSSLRTRFDLVVAEGAGGAAEINLFDRDLINLPLARAAGIPALLVVDIDRGGAFAAAHGTIDLLPASLRPTVAGVVINRFRGEAALLEPGIALLEARTGIPVLGVLPHLGPGPLLGVEDSLDITERPAAEAPTSDPLRVAAIRLPHLANPSDLDPLAVEPDVELVWTRRVADVSGADLVVIPGSRATVTDLAWLRRTGLAAAIERSRASVVGICAGYQMLGTLIVDHVESGAGEVEGLGLLPVTTNFVPTKLVRQRTGFTGAHPLTGYEIRFGQPVVDCESWLYLSDSHGNEAEGCHDSDHRVWETSLHGLFDADSFRAGFLTEVAHRHTRDFQPSAVPFADRLSAQHDRLADWIGDHLDIERVQAIAAIAVPPGSEPGW